MNMNQNFRITKVWTTLLLVWCLMLMLAPTLSVAAPGNHIDWQVVAAAGPPAASATYKLFSVTAQPSPVGEETGPTKKLQAGFLQAFTSGGCCATAGDANNDTKVNVGDAVFMINFVFKAGAAPPCKDQADANHDCKLNVGDAVFLINYVFKLGTAPQCGCVGP